MIADAAGRILYVNARRGGDPRARARRGARREPCARSSARALLEPAALQARAADRGPRPPRALLRAPGRDRAASSASR